MMQTRMTQTRRLLALATVAALYTGLSGCASTGELASLKSQRQPGHESVAGNR
jgi:hypothetical protein